nr:hypothetical protein [Lachnospiraceae bacterium]
MKGKNKYFALAICVAISVAFGGSSLFVSAKESGYSADAAEETNKLVGGGYAASGQLEDVGYTCQLYDATNGLP